MKSFFKRIGFALLSIGCLVGAFMAFQFGFAQLSDVRKIDRLPVTPIAAVTNGVYAVEGYIEDQGKTITAPYSGAKVVYYSYKLEEEYRDSDGNTQTRTLESGESATVFELIDTTGQMTINPDSNLSDIEFSVRQTYKSRNGDLIYTETTLRSGQFIEVLGLANSSNAQQDSTNMLLLRGLPAELKGIVTDTNLKTEGGNRLLQASLFISGATALLALGLAAGMIVFGVHRYWVFVVVMTLGLMGLLWGLGLHHLQKDWREFAQIYQQRAQGVLANPSEFAQNDLYAMYVLVKQSAEQWPDSLLFKVAETSSFQPPVINRADRTRIEQALQNVESSRFSKQWVTLLIAALSFILASVLVWFALKAIRFKRLVEFIPTSSSAGLAYGVCELFGLIDLNDEHPALESHLNSERCVAYRYEIQELRGSGKKRSWRTVESGEDDTAFLLKDSSGRVTVNPAGAQIVFSEKKVKREGKTKYIEHWLPPFRRVYCLGFAGISEADSTALSLQNNEAIDYLITEQDEQAVVKSRGANGFLLTGLAVGFSLMTMTVLLASQGLFTPLDLLTVSLVAPLVLLFITTVLHYNGLVFLQNRVDKTRADIDTLLQRRHDLWPSLMNTVSTYLEHEQKLMTAIAHLRNNKTVLSDGAEEVDKKLEFEQNVIKTFIARMEAYPELKANTLVADFMEKMESSENQLALIRKGYNDSVELYNTQIQKLPDVLLARLFKFKEAVFFRSSE